MDVSVGVGEGVDDTGFNAMVGGDVLVGVGERVSTVVGEGGTGVRGGVAVESSVICPFAQAVNKTNTMSHKRRFNIVVLPKETRGCSPSSL